MKTIFFALSGKEELTARLTGQLRTEAGETTIQQFTDGETYVRLKSDAKGKRVGMVNTFHKPDNDHLSLFFYSPKRQRLRSELYLFNCPLFG